MLTIISSSITRENFHNVSNRGLGGWCFKGLTLDLTDDLFGPLLPHMKSLFL